MKRKGGDQQGSGKKKWKQYQQRGQLQGQGILLTTVRRKERKAGLELIEFLDDLVPKLYPDLDLSIPDSTDLSKSNGAGDHIKDEYDDDDDDLDALRNGEPSRSGDVKPTLSSKEVEAVQEVPKDIPPKEDDNGFDIEAQIKAELQELQPHGNRNHKTKTEEGTLNGVETASNGNNKPRIREKFKLIDPEVECLMFVSVAWPMDPVKLSCALLDEVAKTGQVRGHFIQRLSPIYETSRAELNQITTLAESVMSKYFPKSEETLTFKVDPRLRLHNQLSKMDVIQSIISAVPSPHKADLIKPDYLINVEVFKMVIGIGILPRYEAYKRFNPQMIAQRYQENKVGKQDEEVSRTLQHQQQQQQQPQSNEKAV